MKTPEEFVTEHYQLPQSKIEFVRIASVIRCLERYKEYLDNEIKASNLPNDVSAYIKCGCGGNLIPTIDGLICDVCG